VDEILWTEEALQDLEEIGSYIALDSPRAAEKAVRRIIETIGALAFSP
jgi:toxin ParE1/3/4